MMELLQTFWEVLLVTLQQPTNQYIMAIAGFFVLVSRVMYLQVHRRELREELDDYRLSYSKVATDNTRLRDLRSEHQKVITSLNETNRAQRQELASLRKQHEFFDNAMRAMNESQQRQGAGKGSTGWASLKDYVEFMESQERMNRRHGTAIDSSLL